ncbi:MAG: hypothetical protein JWO32_2512 [Bacteroidetes bacterium]|nr:hypothetical protein [Bacteroidota bacterium]
MKSLFLASLFFFCLPVFSQAPAFEDLVFEEDSVSKPYNLSGKNYAFIKSKRGSGGLSKTSKADSILALTISDIVLVYSETSASATANREEANRERWENLLKTYPELFQFSTSYKNLLQYGKSGDSLAMKKAQGFYVYFGGNEIKEPEVKTVNEIPKENTPAKTISKSESVVETKTKKDRNKPEANEKAEPKEKKERKPKDEPKEITDTKKEDKEPVVAEIPANPIVKKTGYSKPKKAKNAKACRPPFYANGDDDLNNFFKNNITLSKKQKKHSKQLISNVKLQLNFDGSIKKSMVTGLDEELNQQVTAALLNMDLWNPAVKNGLTVKSEVKMTLLYDKSTRSMKPSDILITPRPGPKCECVSDAEMFGTE